MCCNTGECYASQKHRCKCDCTRCRHCDRCGDKGNAKIGLLVAGAVGMWAAASSRSSVKNHWARRPWEESANLRPISESHASYSSDDEDDVTEQRRKRLVSSQSMPESSSLPAGRTQRSMSVSSNSSVGSQSSVFSNSSTDEDPIFARGRSRKNSTQSRGRRASHGSTLASAVTPDSDCVLM